MTEDHPTDAPATQRHPAAARTLRHDVVVVGARCAGESTARLLAQRCHDVRAAEASALARLVEQARRRSAVYDVLTNGVPVTVSVAEG